MSSKKSILWLKWVVGLVLIVESVRFALSPLPGVFARAGIPHWIPAVLGGSEALAALMFLMPPVSRAAGYALLAIFALAAALHVLHRQYDIGGLLIYAMAVYVCVVDGGSQ